MNKKVSTLLVATLLAAGPAFTAAYAASEATSVPAVEVTDGFKFLYGYSETSLLKVKQVTLKNKQVVWTLGDTYTVTGNEEEDIESLVANFEIRNMRKSGNNVLFELWADGHKIYVKENGSAVTEGENIVLTSLYSDFYVEDVTSATDTKFTGNEVGNIKVFVPGTEVALTATKGFTASENYDRDAFTEYNGNVDLKAFSFSFNSATEKLEGNVFTDMIAINGNDGVIFVKGDKKQIEKFVDSKDFSTDGKDLQFIAIQKDATYSINGLQSNEGKKLVWVSGETISKNKDKYVTEFSVNEADRLNAEGELTLGATIGTTKVLVGAVRPSATDNTTYVTTILKETESQKSKFTYIPAQLGSNAYLDASILLNKNAKNVVSVYFTSGTPATGEYHKYLTLDASDNCVAKAYNETDPTLPVNQWIVAGFNGKYKFTLVNRQTGKSIDLSLTKGGEEGGYKVAESIITPSNTEKGLSVKFLPISVTSTDGYMSLTDQQVKEGIKLSFSGKTDLLGEKTFYAVESNGILKANLKEEGLKTLTPELYVVEDANDSNKKKFLFDTKSYAYLNDKGEVAIAADKDTLFIPAYNFVTKVNEDKTKLYLDKYETNKTTKSIYAFVKNAKGKYSLAVLPSNLTANYVMLSSASVATVNENLDFESSWNVKDTDSKFANVNILSGAELNMSLPAQQGHFTFDNERGSISMTDIKGINEGALANEGMVFWLDSVDTDAEMPAFYISRGIEGNEAARMYMYNTIDSAKVFDEASANYKYNDVYFYGEDAQNGKNPELKVGFAAATEETGKDLADQFKFNITLKDAAVADEYILSSVKKISLPNASIEDKQVYVAQKNGVVILTAKKENAMAFTLNPAEAPTSNESVSASEVKVVANNGSVVVKNAAGKNVVVSTILGQVVANEVLTSDNATINVPAGIVVVAVEGESFKVNVK